jgi:hypothetical protein
MKDGKMNISLAKTDMKLIKDFCRKHSFNLSDKTVQLWKQFIDKYEDKSSL